MNYIKENSVGIDCAIKSIQIDLYDDIKSKGFKVIGQGKVYKNNQSDAKKKPIPEFYFNGNYQETFLNDNSDVSFFFLVGDNHKTNDGRLYVASIKIVFWFNLECMDKNQRLDSSAHLLVNRIIDSENFEGLDISGLETGVSNIFREYDYEKILFDDMQPYHLFAFTGTLSYYLIKNC